MTRPKCRRCEKRLAPVYGDDAATRAVQQTEEGPGVATVRSRGPLLGYGYAATGFFCTAQCGHWFAIQILRGERSDESKAV